MSAIPPAMRAAVLERDSSRCRWCGTPTTELHHIIYRSQGGKHEASNLITLCSTHHAQAHSNKRRYAPILLAVLEFEQRGMSLSVPQVMRWLGRDDGAPTAV